MLWLADQVRCDAIRKEKQFSSATHNIGEAIQLPDRVLVMSNRPATAQKIVEIDLPRQRDLEFFRLMGMSPRVGESQQPNEQV